MPWQPRQVSWTSGATSGWKVSVSLASMAKKIGSRPARPIGELTQVAYGDRLSSRPLPCGSGSVMSNCSPVPPASWQPRHWSEVMKVCAGSVAPPAPTQTLS